MESVMKNKKEIHKLLIGISFNEFIEGAILYWVS